MPSKVSQQRQLRSTRSRLPSAPQAGIQNFARASKPGATATDVKKKAKEVSVTTSSRKRKLEEAGEGKCDDREDSLDGTAATKLSKARKLDRPVAASPATTVQPKSKTLPPSPSLSRSSSVDSVSTHEHSEDTPPSSFSSTASDSFTRPTSFDDLLSLHSAFLAALAIHYAHNGSSGAADLRTLCLHMEKIWKKRKVVVKDIQRLVYVLGLSAKEDAGADFRVADYGKGKICLERPDTRDESQGFFAPLDETRLSEIFSRNLERLWQNHGSESGGKESPNNDFAESIPLAPIHQSHPQFNPLRKGQLRLQDLKAGVITVKAERERESRAKALESSKLKKDAKATNGRRMGLLERIKNKESEQAKLPPPPSKNMLMRQSAAHRIEDVAGVLLQLRPAGSAEMDTSNAVPFRRKPYKLANVIQNVQDSTGNPISNEEIEMCLDIMTHPSVAGDWVSLIAIGKLRSVVLKSGTSVSPRDIAMKAAEQQGL